MSFTKNISDQNTLIFSILTLLTGLLVSGCTSSEANFKIVDAIDSYQVNCGAPNSDSIVFSKGILKMKLSHKDVGRCDTDPHPYNSARYQKPWSERAEVVFQHYLLKDRINKIKFQMKILQGYTNWNQLESWFQIKCQPTSKVPVMAFLRKGGYQEFRFNLSAGSRYSKQVDKRSPVELKYNEWFDVEILFENFDRSRLSVAVDNLPVLSSEVFGQIPSCPNDFTLRLGIYRAGNDQPGNMNKVSEIAYKNLSFEIFQR